MFGWKKKQNKITSYTQNSQLMELYEELDPDYLEKLADLGRMALSNVFIQRAIYSSKKNLREITTEIIFPAAAEHIQLHDLVYLHIWMETSGKAKELAQDDAEMFLKYFMEEINKLPQGWNKHKY